MILLDHVSKSFQTGGRRVAAVEEVSLAIPAGQIAGIIGQSGAGKSTLIRLLNGLEKPSSGQVLVAGRDIGRASGEELRQARLKIGMIFQHFNLLWSRTVRGNVAFALEIAGVERVKARARVEELIRLVGLEGREDAYPSQLSGGQKQRVGIARALANEPQLLLCDEATSALDPQTTDQILDLLSEINRRLGLTIVLITHEMHVVRRICDHVAVMAAGRVVEEGPVAEVFARPREKITQRFIRQSFAEGGGFDPALAPPQGVILRLTYAGEGAPTQDSVLSEAILSLSVKLSVLQARLSQTPEGVSGDLYAHLADPGQLARLTAFLMARGVGVEILRGS